MTDKPRTDDGKAETMVDLATKTLNCPNCGVASSIGVCELNAAYLLGAKAERALIVKHMRDRRDDERLIEQIERGEHGELT